MADNITQAGYYTLDNFFISPMYESTSKSTIDKNLPSGTELNRVIVNWGISEGMDSGYIHGFAVVHESDNILKDLPIVGEENLIITFTDYYGSQETTKFIVYAVDEITPEAATNSRMMKYVIRFCSKQKLHADQKEIRRSYGDQKVSSMVQSLYDEYFTTGNADIDKDIEIEETSGEQTLVIPNLRPDEAMAFLSRRAFSAQNKSSLFRFFETRDKYYFCTHEYLIDKYKKDLKDDATAIANNLKFIFNTTDDNSAEGQYVAQQSISTVNYGQKTNSMNDMKLGAYRRRVTELDYMHRTRITRDYDYSEEFNEYKHIDKLKLTHSKNFVNQYMHPDDAPETVLLADYPQIGSNQGKGNMMRPYQYYYENYTTKPIVEYHLMSNSITISISGRRDLYPGMLINLELFDFSETVAQTRVLDEERTGTYLVLSVQNSFNEDTYSQELVVTKGGLGGINKVDIDASLIIDETFNIGNQLA